MKKILLTLMAATLVSLSAQVSSAFKNVSPGSGSFQNISGSAGEFRTDRSEFRSAPSSLLISKSNAQGWSGQLVTLETFSPLQENREVEISFQLKADCRSGYVVLLGENAENSQKVWMKCAVFNGIFNWRKFQCTAVLPPGIRRLRISFRLDRGAGRLWVNDLHYAWKKSDRPLLYNNGFEGPIDKTTGIPEGWHRRVFPDMETEAEITVGAPASGWCPAAVGSRAAKITWKGGGSRSGLQTPFLRISTSRKYAVHSYFMGINGGKGGCQADFYDKNKKIIGSSSSLPYSTGNWKWMQKKFIFQVPADTCFFRLTFLLTNRGQVCYDEIILQNDDGSVEEELPLEAECHPVLSSLTWNKGRPVFNTFADSPVPLSFEFRGIRKYFRNPALVLEVPAGVLPVQCFVTDPSNGKAVKPVIRNLSHNGVKYTGYVYSDRQLWDRLQPLYELYHRFAIALVPENASAVGRSFKIRWHLENAGKRGTDHAFELTFLPALQKLPLPKNFSGGYWNSFSMNFPDKELFLKVARKFEYTNMTGRNRDRRLHRFDDLLKERGWNMSTRSWMVDHSYNSGPPRWYAEIPEGREVMRNLRGRQMSSGKINMRVLCPEYFLHDPVYGRFSVPAMKKRLNDIGHRPGEIVMLDSEPWGTMTWCFDEACRKAFMRHAGLKTVPSQQEILKNHRRQWIEFRVGQTRDGVRRYHDLIRQADPKAVILDYDYPIDYDAPDLWKNFQNCAKDPRINEKYLDGHLSSYYHTLGTRGFDMMRINRKHLRSPYYIFLAIDPPGGYLSDHEILSPRQYRLFVEAAASLGIAGVWVYNDSETDGLFFTELQKGLAQIAGIEEFLQTPEVSGLLRLTAAEKAIEKLPLRWSIHRREDRILLSLFNYAGSTDCKVRVSPTAGGILSVHSLPDGNVLPVSGNAVLCDIPAESAAYFLLHLKK